MESRALSLRQHGRLWRSGHSRPLLANEPVSGAWLSVWHYAAATRLATEDIDARFLDILEACAEPRGDEKRATPAARCATLQYTAQVPRTLHVVLPGQVQSFAAALAVARPGMMVEQWSPAAAALAAAPSPAAASPARVPAPAHMTREGLEGRAVSHSFLVAGDTAYMSQITRGG